MASKTLYLLTICCLAISFSLEREGAAAQRDVLFHEIASERGLDFSHVTGATGAFFLPEIMGPGVALFDYDGDGDLDVYLLQGRRLDPDKSEKDLLFSLPVGYRPGNRLFRNDLIPDGSLSFTDVTEAAGVGHMGYGMGVAVGDYDNDGDLDLYVTNFGPNVLYRNNDDGTFSDVTETASVDDPRWSTSAAFVDYDRDGDLDLILTNYVDFTIKGNKDCYAATGEADYCTPAAYRALPDRLFRNDGRDRFTDVTHSAGISKAYGPGLGVICADFNGDGWSDIYVANDGTANLLWLNQGDGTFVEEALLCGVAHSGDGIPQGGMGVTAGDVDQDGDEDLLVTNLALEGSVLYRNDGRGFFHDATREFGLAEPSFPFTGFGAHWFDYDNDGRLDLFAVNGAVTIVSALRGTPYPYQQRNQLFHNEGTMFRETTAAAGSALELREVSRGAAFGDVDNDGDIDVVISNNNGPVRLLLNEIGSRLPWLRVRLEGLRDNRFGLGARVVARRKDGAPVWRRVHTDGSYLSAGDSRVHFGFGKASEIEAIEVYWPSGMAEAWAEISINQEITLRQGTGTRIGVR